MHQKYILTIAKKTNLKTNQIENVLKLNTEGATIPFMARYRKEVTGNMDEVQLEAVVDFIKYFTELEKRKETVLKTIQELGKLTPELEKRITDCIEDSILEDIYLPYKPKRKTKALMAIEKGLEPLAKLIFELTEEDIITAANTFLNEHVATEQEALQGARDIVAEWIAENETVRNKLRLLFNQEATISSKLLSSKKEDIEAQKYKDYFEFSEPLQKCPSHRLLAIRRGEKEGFLSMIIGVEKQKAIDIIENTFILKNNGAAHQFKLAIEDSFTRLLKSSVETEYRLSSKNIADDNAIKVFAENLRQLLLGAPLGEKNILAIDPGYRTGCKVVCLNKQGLFLHNTTIYPHAPVNDINKSKDELMYLVHHYNIEAIAIGNGTAGRETEQLARSIDFGTPVQIFQVSENGASIYSASDVAREEFPQHDVTVRGSISIGRRLLDPLSELVKIDPKSIGVGQYQHDVNQTKLKESLDRVVESCVNFVGVNVNTASKHLLAYVSGLNTNLAKNIVSYRDENGPFTNRKELKKVSLMGPKSFEQCAGFLKIPNAENILDSSSVHPERYELVAQMAKEINVNINELVKNSDARKKINLQNYINEQVGIYTIEDILKELEKPGLDPREQLEIFEFDANLKTIEDVKQGMTVPGIVTNITNFGAFVDIGVKQDGLVHISQMGDKFITDPTTVVKLLQRVMVTITEIDIPRKRIQLSMKTLEKKNEKKEIQIIKKPITVNKNNSNNNSFLDKLAAIKAKL